MKTAYQPRTLLSQMSWTSSRSTCVAAVLIVLAICVGCARTPPVTPSLPPTFDEKMGWILRLEDQRVLSDTPRAMPLEAESSEASAPPTAVSLRPEPDLVALLTDSEPQLRRRAALAIGRVGRAEGTAPLVARLADPEPEVRQMAAFALGLIGDPSATDALIEGLQDPSPMVQGRAAEALGRIGAIEAAEPVAALVRQHATSAFGVDPEDVSYPQAPEVEAFRLGLYALADLDAFEPLAGAVLQDNGEPILWWWPVAYALQRLEDPRALTALTTLAGVQGSIGVSFAAQGLGGLGIPAAIEPLVTLLDLERRDGRVVAAALRALARFEEPGVTATLRNFILTKDLDPTLRLTAVEALVGRPDADAVTIFIELISDPWPPMRAGAFRGLARADPETFIRVLSALEPDPDWRVRTAVAQALAHADPDAAVGQLTRMLADEDQRVLPSVLSSMVAHEAPSAASMLFEHLRHDDVVVRKTAARLLATLRPPDAAEALASAYRAAEADSSYLARAAALEALAALSGPLAGETLRLALADADWAVRVLAARLLSQLEPDQNHASRITPAPGRRSVDYAAPHLISPSVSPHVYIETERGTIQIELAVLDAPLHTENFVALARQGFFDGLTFHRVVYNYIVQSGDPRSDSEGGPGYTLRDELNQVPFLRGTVGTALDWEDTGGSQFFITYSPQPQLDGEYTAFGRVVAGTEVVDQLRQGDVIQRVWIWDGLEPLQP